MCASIPTYWGGSTSTPLELSQKSSMKFAPHLTTSFPRLSSLSHFFASRSPARCYPAAPRLVPQVIMDSQSKTPSASSSSSQPKLQSSRRLRFGTTHVIQPKGEHRATVVWLHGLGDVGASWAEVLEDLPIKNIKWIVPTAPVQPVAIMGGFPCNAWFDVGSLSEEGPNDVEGLDASAAHVAGLLSQESLNIKLGIGGFSQGAATSIYTTACSLIGSYSDGTRFPYKLDITVAISGWLPSAKTVQSRFQENSAAVEQAKGYSIFLGHGTNDDVVLFKFGEKSATALQASGFNSLLFKTYKGLGHYTNSIEMDDICTFFKERLQLED